jgi:exonuclease III
MIPISCAVTSKTSLGLEEAYQDGQRMQSPSSATQPANQKTSKDWDFYVSDHRPVIAQIKLNEEVSFNIVTWNVWNSEMIAKWETTKFKNFKRLWKLNIDSSRIGIPDYMERDESPCKMLPKEDKKILAHRDARMLECIRHLQNSSSIICLQEVHPELLDSIKQLSTDFECYSYEARKGGNPPCDKNGKEEWNVIGVTLVNKVFFKVLGSIEYKIYFYDDKKNHWDNFVQVLSVSHKDHIYKIFHTHLPGGQDRDNSLKLLAKYMNSFFKKDQEPYKKDSHHRVVYLLMGDLNMGCKRVNTIMTKNISPEKNMFYRSSNRILKGENSYFPGISSEENKSGSEESLYPTFDHIVAISNERLSLIWEGKHQIYSRLGYKIPSLH